MTAEGTRSVAYGSAVVTDGDRAELPAVTVGRMVHGHWLAQALYVACELRLCDLVSRGPVTAEEVASAADADALAVQRLLRLLASHGVVGETDDGRFEATALSEQLRLDVPGTLGPYAHYVTGPQIYQACGDLLYSVRTGGPAFDHLFGVSVFEYFREHSDAGPSFDAAMSSAAQSAAEQVSEAYDFSGFATVADVGGGRGILLATILRKHPGVSGVLFDLPGVIAQAPALLEREGVAGRCRVVGGDFFDGVPDGADAYMLKSVIHDWDDERSVAILSRCRAVIPSSGRLLVIERVLPERVTPSVTDQRITMMDLNMLALAVGRERTMAQLTQLLEQSGFTLLRDHPTTSDFHVLEAIPA